MLTKISVTLFAGSLLLKQVVGWDMVTSSIILVIATGIYTIAGGLSAVIYTELIQTFILIGGALVLTLLGLNEVGWISGLMEKVPADYFHMFKPMDHPDFPWAGIIFGAPILGIWYWCTDQFIVQRVLSAKNISEARSGTIFAGFLKILPVFILVFPGIIAKALYPEIQGDQAYPVLVTRLLPIGLKGIVIASLLAALMSSLASCFNSSSTLFTMDIYKKLKPEASENQLVLIGRISTGVLVILGILWVPFIKYISSQIYIYLQSVQAYVSPPIAVVFLLGVFWSGANGKGAISALLSGLFFGGLRLILELMHKQHPFENPLLSWYASMNFLHFAIFLFVLSVMILIIVSKMTGKPAEDKVKGLTFKYAEMEKADEELLAVSPQRHRLNLVFSVLLIFSIVILWIVFF